MAARGPVVRGPAAQPGTARQPALVRGDRRARSRRRGARRGADGHRLSAPAEAILCGAAAADHRLGSRQALADDARRNDFPRVAARTQLSSALSVDLNLQLTADRIGIASQASCAAATDPAAVGAVLARHGCEAMLRATYVDGTDTYVITVGVAAMPGSAQVNAAKRELAGVVGGSNGAGVRTVPVAGSPAACVHRLPPAALRQHGRRPVPRLLRDRVHRRPAERAG